MSTVPTYSVFCDGWGNDCEFWTANAPTAKGAKEVSRKEGWRGSGGRDICPKCWAGGFR